MAIVIKGFLYDGLSTDVKPTVNVPVNTRFLETDTGNEYQWTGAAWIRVTEFGTTPLAADEAHRGMFYFTQGGAGVADLLYCIMKGADNNYTAIQVAIG